MSTQDGKLETMPDGAAVKILGIDADGLPVLSTPGTGGPAPWSTPTAWSTGVAYTATMPASAVTQGGSLYICLASHTSGTFATDLAAGKWRLVAQKGDTGAQGPQGETGPTGPTGPVSYSAVVAFAPGITALATAPITLVTHLGSTYYCITAHTTTGTFEGAKWAVFAAKGTDGAGAGDMLAANNLGDVASPSAARANLGLGTAATQASTAFAAATHSHAISDVTNLQTSLDAKVATSLIGAANGIAPLDAGSKVAAAYLPSYVDDVVEAANFAALPGTGETGKIYVTLDSNKIYRWSGSAYIEISASPGSSDAVSEGSTNLYFTAARTRAAALTGLSTATNAAITAADTVLEAAGKLQAQVSNLLGTFLSALKALGPNLVAGDIIYATAANAVARLAKGTDGQVLTLASGVPSWANAAAGSGWTKVSTWTWSTNVAQVDFTGLGGYREVMFVFFDVFASADVNIFARLSADNGATFAATGYKPDSASTGLLIGQAGATIPMAGCPILFGLSDASEKTLFLITYMSAASSYYNTTRVDNAVRILPASGNFTAGKIVCYGRN